MPFNQNQGGAASDGTNTYNPAQAAAILAAPKPAYPRNRTSAIQYKHGATQQRNPSASPVSDAGSPRPQSPWSGGSWTNPGGPGVQLGSRASADPASGYAGYQPGTGWGGQVPMPRPGGPRVTPAGMPGPTKYSVRYAPNGQPISESYDAGNAPPEWLNQVMTMDMPAERNIRFQDPAAYEAYKNRVMFANQDLDRGGSYQTMRPGFSSVAQPYQGGGGK